MKDYIELRSNFINYTLHQIKVIGIMIAGETFIKNNLKELFKKIKNCGDSKQVGKRMLILEHL